MDDIEKGWTGRFPCDKAPSVTEVETRAEGTTMDRQQSTVERFLKLGYSYGDILRVLETLHHDAQTNDILQELLRTSRSADSSPSSSRTSSPQLVARGCSPPLTPWVSRTPVEEKCLDGRLRPIVIDGSNVAMSHGNKQVFSCRGVQLAVNWFWDRGHRDITVFVPLWRKEQPRPDTPITDQHILYELEQSKILVFTPSRCVNGKRVVCYDDRYIVKLAFDSDGIIVSNDNYRDLQLEKPEWKKFIEERLLMFTFANDKFMPPDDPLGRNGPTIDDLLRKNPKNHEGKRIHCPYGKKCTYGIKCKYYHPERMNQSQLSVADELRAKTKPALEWEVTPDMRPCSPGWAATSDTPSFKASFSDQGQGDPLYDRLWPSKALSQEDVSNRPSPNEHRSPGPPRKSPTCLSIESDDVFGSLEETVGHLYIHDQVDCERLPHHYSGGNACSHQVNGSTSPVLTHRTDCRSSQRQSMDMYPLETHYITGARRLHDSYSHLAHGQTAFDRHMLPHSLHQHQHHQLPRVEPAAAHYCHSHALWGVSSLDPTVPVSDSTSERRRNTRIQLGTIFPQSTVDQAMRLYPHTMEMSDLVPLIHQLRTKHIHF